MKKLALALVALAGFSTSAFAVTNGVATYAVGSPGAVAMTVGTSYTAQRALAANCSVAGNMVITFADGSTATIAVAVGYQAFPFAVTKINSQTATCTYYNLK